MTTSNNRYDVSIQANEWGHSVTSYSTKKEAIKRAKEIRSIGCNFTDSLQRNELSDCTILVYDNKKKEQILVAFFTKKYLSFRKTA